MSSFELMLWLNWNNVVRLDR